MKKNVLLKAALLSVCIVSCSANAIVGNISAMAASMPEVPLYLIELMTTIPSLTMMIAVLFSAPISKCLGAKNSLLLALIICTAGGIAPFFFSSIYIMLLSRAFFGFGAGMISSGVLSLIFYFFQGSERSFMIGMQGSAGGLGSLLTTL